MFVCFTLTTLLIVNISNFVKTNVHEISNEQIYRETDTERQTDRQTDTHTHKHIAHTYMHGYLQITKRKIKKNKQKINKQIASRK